MVGMMVAIKFKQEYFSKIKSGSKTQTLRTPTHRIDVVPGDFAVCVFPGLEDKIFITITDVGYKYFKDLDIDDANREGFNSVEELKKTLLEIYPTLDNSNRLYYYRFMVDGFSERVGN